MRQATDTQRDRDSVTQTQTERRHPRAAAHHPEQPIRLTASGTSSRSISRPRSTSSASPSPGVQDRRLDQRSLTSAFDERDDEHPHAGVAVHRRGRQRHRRRHGLPRQTWTRWSPRTKSARRSPSSGTDAVPGRGASRGAPSRGASGVGITIRLPPCPSSRNGRGQSRARPSASGAAEVLMMAGTH